MTVRDLAITRARDYVAARTTLDSLHSQLVDVAAERDMLLKVIANIRNETNELGRDTAMTVEIIRRIAMQTLDAAEARQTR